MRDRDHPPVPIATYRLQLTPTFGFDATVGVLDHLARLGVSHVYVSPIAEAVPGSTHGYDVVDHRVVRRDFGGDAGLERLLDELAGLGMGLIVDHVPNHVSAAAPELNEPWWATLRDGPDGDGARWFDIDWASTGGRVLVPKLGDPLDEVLASGGLSIATGDLGPELRYGPLRFPLRPGTEHLDLADAVAQQHYELVWWRDRRRNVRRFFTIDDLVAVRVEDPAVATVVDTIPTRLAEHPAFAGVRVDHVDGLADLRSYLAQLRERIGDDRLLYVEKILAPGEWLPESWPVDGTTGYEHIRVTEHAFVEPGGVRTLTATWHELTGDQRSFATIEDDGRREVLDGGLAPDLERFVRASGTEPDVATELTIALHRYRTYLPGDTESDHQLDLAVERARTARPDLAAAIDDLATTIRSEPDVAARWQQLTSPVMAKGAEDRAFYRYLPLASLCEVGGAPGDLGIDDATFHEHQRQVQVRMPQTLTAGTTHDTKRSEGVRARSLVLAEIADEWTAAARSWIDAHGDLVAKVDAATVWLALQTAVTAWPVDAQRLTEYLRKSAREAEVHTSWTDPDEGYETALAALATVLARELLDTATSDVPFGGTAPGPLGACVSSILRPGWSNSLAALAVRLTAPGVPDLYQGTSAFTYSLVDPDNRAEPNWDARRALVAAAARTNLAGAWGATDPSAARAVRPSDVEMTDVGLADVHDSDVEAAKAVVITRTLALRRRRPQVFGRGAGYVPVTCEGPAASRLLAFGRGSPPDATGDDMSVTDESDVDVVVLVVRRSIGSGDWRGTTVALPPGTWTDILTDDAPVRAGGADVPVAWFLAHAPVAILERTAR